MMMDIVKSKMKLLKMVNALSEFDELTRESKENNWEYLGLIPRFLY